jgi:hypothetical protein
MSTNKCNQFFTFDSLTTSVFCFAIAFRKQIIGYSMPRTKYILNKVGIEGELRHTINIGI